MKKAKYNSLTTLLENWKTHRENYTVFCEDGILVEDEFRDANPKILFLLKETYKHFSVIRGELGPRGTSKTFWRRMRMWTYIVEEKYHGRDPDIHFAKKIKEEPNRKIAYVNIKKNAEKEEYNNEAYSNDADIHNYAKKDKFFLQEQIRLIDPDVILCCSTVQFCEDIFGDGSLVQLSERLYKKDKIWIIDYEHPSQRKAYEKNIAELSRILAIDAFSERQ